MMLRIFTSAILVIFVIWFISALRSSGLSLNKIIGKLFEDSQHGILSIKNNGLKVSNVRPIAYFWGVVSAIVLAVSAFLPYAVFGEMMSGGFLMLHIAVSPIFAICAAVSAVVWAQENKLSGDDGLWIIDQIKRTRIDGTDKSRKSGLRFCFWAMMILALMLIDSAFWGMSPLLNSVMMKTVMSVHFSSGLLFILLMIVQSVILVKSQPRSQIQPRPHSQSRPNSQPRTNSQQRPKTQSSYSRPKTQSSQPKSIIPAQDLFQQSVNKPKLRTDDNPSSPSSSDKPIRSRRPKVNNNKSDGQPKNEQPIPDKPKPKYKPRPKAKSSETDSDKPKIDKPRRKPQYRKPKPKPSDPSKKDD